MIAHWNIEQGTEDWHKIRYGKIGGTLSGGLLVDSDTLLIDLLSTQLEPFELTEDDFRTFDMMRGNDLEPEARRILSEKTGIEFKQCGWLQSESILLLGISPDGISEDLTKACEIKCPARKKHTETILNGEIPKDNIKQCIHYFTVNSKLEELYFCSFRPESKYPMFDKKMVRTDMINIGTKANPVMNTVDEVCNLIRANAIKMQTDIEAAIKNLELVEQSKTAF